MNISEMQKYYREFVQKRDWETFHNPKNLCMALSVEAAELMEIFQWLSAAQSQNIKENEERLSLVKEEMADVFSYLIRLADVLDIDLEKAFWEKFQKNEKKYPITFSKELSRKIKSS